LLDVEGVGTIGTSFGKHMFSTSEGKWLAFVLSTMCTLPVACKIWGWQHVVVLSGLGVAVVEEDSSGVRVGRRWVVTSMYDGPATKNAEAAGRGGRG